MFSWSRNSPHFMENDTIPIFYCLTLSPFILHKFCYHCSLAFCILNILYCSVCLIYLKMICHRYLRTHDEAFKRLWFLWSGESTNSKAVGRCGCIGGCAFFGTNRNGAKFFKPSRDDFQDGVNMAAFRWV